ncbi:MAG: hypothetical protein P8K08_12520 [Fuerstiella sp.]|nr:hypothetical protein [Fuerstiella sp.]
MLRGDISNHAQAVNRSADAGPDDVSPLSGPPDKSGDGHCETFPSLFGEGFGRSGVDVVNFLPCGRHGGSSVSTGGGDGDGVVKSRRFVGSGKGRIKIRQGLRQTVTCSGRPSCDDRTTAGD